MNLSSKKPHQQTFIGSLLGFLSLVLLIPLTMHAYFGTFARYISDDYCTAWTLGEKGILQSQVYWYTGWSGRYSFTLFVNLLEALGPRIAQILPGFSLLVWIIGILFLLRQISRSLNVRLDKLPLLVISTATVFTIADGVPNTFQSIYWLTGISTYTVPLILAVFYGHWLMRQASRGTTDVLLKLNLGLSALIAFILGGFSETYVSIQTAMLTATLVIALGYRRVSEAKRLSGLLLTGLAGSIASMIVILIAPGTSVRTGLISNPASILVIVQHSLMDLKIFLSLALKSQLPLLLVCGIVPGLFILLAGHKSIQPSGDKPGKVWKWALSAILPPLLMLLMMLASIVPYEYAVSSYPDARVLITTQAIMIMGIIVWSLILGKFAIVFLRGRENRLRPWILALLMLVLGGTTFISRRSTIKILDALEDIQYFAESWDQRDTFLREASLSGLKDVTAASLNHMGGLDEIGYDPNEWINRCVAQYYELKTVVAK